jgi:D-alanyl-D-alanine carboxypeptidase (penicillin-binding protein 5/6)
MAAVVLDEGTERILYAKNPDLKLPPASTTKLVTAMVAMDRLRPEQIITVSKKAARTPSVAPRLIPGQRLQASDLLYLALMRSINGAAVALAEAVSGSEWEFTKLMNEKAHEVGAMNTRFINSTGLPGNGQYITALDLAKIMKASLQYPLIREVMNTREKVLVTDKKNFFLRNTNRTLWSDSCFIGGKTGFTRAARHCLAFAATVGQSTFVAALLGESVRDSLWTNASALLSTSELVARGEAPPEIYVSAQTPVLLASYDISKSAKKTKHYSKKKRASRKHKALHAKQEKHANKKIIRAKTKKKLRNKKRLEVAKDTLKGES